MGINYPPDKWDAIIIACGLVIIVSLSLLFWFVGRKIHYKFAYENMVRATVKDMVKSEALK